jgi:hypothetical protein
LLFVILLILAADDAFPPLAMLQIPLNCFLDTCLEGFLGFPAEFALDFACVDGVAAVVSGAVFDKGDEAFRFAKFLQDEFNDVDVSLFVVSADVVDFTEFATMQHDINRAAVVFDIKPITHI